MVDRPSEEFLLRYAKAAFTNANDLISDADVLLAAGRVPRVFSLAVLAVEELSKSLLISMWVLAERQGNPLEPEVLWAGLRTHSVKLMMPHLMLSAFKAQVDTPLQQEITRLNQELPRIAGNAKTSNFIKQASLYATHHGTNVETPTEAITPDHAASQLSFAKSWVPVIAMLERDFKQSRLGDSGN